MPDRKFKTPNGKIASEKQLQEKYGSQFNSLIENKTFTEVNESVYKTPNGSYEAESVLKSKYGEKFTELTQNNTFVLDTPLKKKGDTTSTSTTKIPSTESVQKNGSSATQEFEYKPKIDAKTGKEVYYTDKSGNLVPAQEKVLKGYATERETALIQKDELKQKALKPYKPSVNYTQYKKSTDVSQEEKDEKLSEINAKINNEGVLNKVGSAFRWMGDVIGNKVAPLLGEDINPNLGEAFSEEKKQAIEILKKELKVQSPDQINPKLILEKTKELALEKGIEAIKINKNNEFLSNLSDKDKQALEIEKVQHYKTLSDKDKYLMTEGALLKEDIEQTVKEGIVIKKVIENFIERGEELPDNLAEHAINLENSYKEKLTSLDKLGTSYKENVSEIGSIEEEIDFLKRNYDTFDKVKTFAKLGAGDLYVNLAKGLPLIVDSLNNNNLSKEVREDLIDDLIDWENAKENERSKLKKDVSFDNLKLDNFGEFFAQEIGTQIPIFAQIALPGGVASMGVTSTADKYGQMEVENKELGKGYSRSQMFATSVGFGLSETILGSLPTKGILNRSVISFEKAGQRTLLKEGIGSYIKKKGATIGDDFLMETVTEGLTQLTQNFLDRKILGKTDIGLFDGVSHAAFSGGMFGGGMSIAPAIIGTALRPFSDNKSGRTVRDNMESIFRLQSELNNPDISKVARKTIEDKINLVESQNKEILTSIAKKTETMPTEIIDAIIGVTKKQELLTLQATEIKNDASLNAELKKELIQGLEVEYNTLEKKRADLVSDKATVLDALSDSELMKLKDKAGRQLIKEAEESGKKEASFNDTQITAKALEIYSKREINKEAKKAEKEQLVVEKTTTDTKEQVTEVEPASSVSKINSNKSTEDLEKRQFEIEGDKSNSKEYNEIDKELEKREWQSIMLSPINEVEDILDTLIEKEKTRPNGFGSFIEKRDVRESKVIAKKYQGEVSRKEAIKDFKDAFFGNPSSWYADGLKLKESVRAFTEQGGSFKDLLLSVKNEFEGDGFTEIEAADIINKKLSEVKKANETTQGEDIVFNESIRFKSEPMGEVAESGPTTTGTLEEKSVSNTNESKPIKGVNEVSISKNGQTYNVEKSDTGEIIVKNKKGEKPSNKTVAKVLNKFSETINFTEGARVSDTNETSAETYLDDVAERSENASEISEAIAFAQTQDFNDNINPIELAIARALGEKSVERSSFTQEGDRNTINASIGLQYFAKKGKGRGLDQIAMDVEYEIYGDYDAINPRVTTQDVVDFIVSNPGGTQKFLSENKNAKLDALKTAFTDVTGLPAHDNFIQKALKQDSENSSRLHNEEVLYALSTEELIKLDEEYNQFKQYENEQKRNDTGNERSVDSKNKEKRNEEPRVQESRRESVGKKQEVKERIAERIKIKNAKIDDIANTIKDMDSLFGFKIKADNIDGVDKQGIDFIAVIADIVKQAVAAGIHIDEAIKKTVEHFQKTYDLDSDTISQVKEKLNPKKEPLKKNNDKNSFEYNASFVPNSDIIGEYLSGETTEKHTGEKVEVDQTINKVKLVDALRHGVDTIELAKIEYGDDFVSKTLEFLEDANIPPHAKALTYVSLSNELDRQRKEFPEDRSRIQKQIDLVDKKRQNFARQNSLAINMSRLQAFAKLNYDITEKTDLMFSSQELSDRKKIEKTVEATADEINEEYARQEEGEDDSYYDFVMPEPKTKRTKEDAKKDFSDALKALKADMDKLARGGFGLSASLPFARQIEIASPHIFKMSKAMLDIGGYTTKEIVDFIHESIINSFPGIKKKDVSDVLRNKYDKENVSKTPAPKVKKASKEVKDLLIEAGYSREANVTVNQKDADGNNVLDAKGNVVRVKERRTYFDWKKLAGEEGSVANMKERVEKVLKLKGYSDAQIQEANIRLKDEYTDLRASIIEKGIREMNNRNKVKPSVNIRGTARKLAELYNFGIFEENTTDYNLLLNSALGFSEFQQETYKELEKYGKALASLMSVDSKYAEGQKLSDLSIQTITSQINNEIKKITATASFRSGTKAYKSINVVSDYTNLSQLSKLMSLKQLIENPASGFIERQFQHVGEMFDNIDTKDLKADRKKIAEYIIKDIVRNGALHYGDVSTTLVNKSKVEDWLNSQSDNQVYHTVVSAMTARAYLNGADSFNKALITEKMFNQNIIKMLTSDSNPNGKITKSEAIAFVSETLTGQNKEDALKTAEEVIDKVNKDSGFIVIKKNEATIARFAQDIVRESLLVGTNLTIDNITDAYNAGYKSAGFALGHEANNIISKEIGAMNSRIDVKLEKAVKEKKWDTAVRHTVESILVKNIMNPFVGGGMNWVTLTASKAGVNPISMISLYADWVDKKDNPLDMTTEQGVKNIQNALMRDTNFKKTASRNLIGSAVSISMAAAMIASGADDDLDDWLKNNKWAEKYFNTLSPPMVVAILAYENDELGKYFIGTLNMKTDQMNEMMKTFKSLQDSKTSTLGAVGKLSGTAFDTPVPWRMAKDVKNVVRGIKGLPIIKSDYNKTGFWNGYFQGGFIDEIEFRPGVNYELKEKIQIVKDEAKDHSDKIKKIADKYSDGKLSDTQMEEAVREAILEDVEKAEKTIDILKDRIPKNEMNKIKDPFYLSFKRESNDEVRALLFFDKFGDIQNLSDEMFEEMGKNMEIVKYKPSDDFKKHYAKIVEESKKQNKE